VGRAAAFTLGPAGGADVNGNSSSAPAPSRQQLWYGRDGAPAPREELHAGELTVILEGPEICAVRRGDVELLRRVYMAVRDERWDTIDGIASELELDRGEREFTARFTMRHARADLSFAWTGTITGARDGTLSYELEGEATSAFRFCRIGFCLLHPPEQHVGQRYRGRTPDSVVEGTLPSEIGPQTFADDVYWPLFPSVHDLDLWLAGGGRLKLAFEGDLFEMEDQRNWTDASFKTYCTPQALGYPFDATPGQRFWQKVTIRAQGASPRSAAAPAIPHVQLNLRTVANLPPLGFTLPRERTGHSEDETELLRLAAPRHLRVDLDLSAPAWRQRLAGATHAAAGLGCGLELAAFLDAEQELALLLTNLAGVQLARLLFFSRGREISDPTLTGRGRALAQQAGIAAPVLGGTDLWFAELNRDHPDVGAMDGLVFSITPQVHTFDEESIAQSLAAQPDTIRTARSFAAGKPISVSPVTLRPRDPIEGEPADQGPLPFSVDPRQPSLFAAAFTIGSISALAQAGAASLTFYETVGPRGVIPGDAPPPPAIPASPPPGGAFAMFHVFADIAEMGTDVAVGACESSRPAEVVALVLRGASSVRVLVANLTPAPVSATVGPFPANEVWIRTLDEDSAWEAMADPRSFRAQAGRRHPLADRVARLELAPFAVARLDT
jgi:D-apionolactonase